MLTKTRFGKFLKAGRKILNKFLSKLNFLCSEKLYIHL